MYYKLFRVIILFFLLSKIGSLSFAHIGALNNNLKDTTVVHSNDTTTARSKRTIIINLVAKNGIFSAAIPESRTRYHTRILHSPQNRLIVLNDFDLSNSTIDDTANFSNINYKAELHFESCSFKNSAKFINDIFSNQATVFSDALFLDTISFKNATFGGPVDFSNTAFKSAVDFSDSKFHGFADFTGIILDSAAELNFFNTQLPDLMDLSSIQIIKKNIDLTGANFEHAKFYENKRWHYINVFHSDISKIIFDYQHFRLCFYNNLIQDRSMQKYLDSTHYKGNNNYYNFLISQNDFVNYVDKVFPSADIADPVIKTFVFYCLRVQKFPKSLREDQIYAIYEKVLKTFDKEGQKISYEDADVEYKNYENGYFILPYIWNCYGYKKWLIFLWTFFFLILFTSITYFHINDLNKRKIYMGVYSIGNIPINISSNTLKQKMRKIKFSLLYTSMIFFLLNLNFENLNFKKRWVFYILIVYIIGILCLGFIANFVLQK